MEEVKQKTLIVNAVALRAYELMCIARSMAQLYDVNRDICSRYVHSTSRGHEAIQLAAGFLLTANDFASPYYRDESMLLAIGLSPLELMLQLLAKKDDPFSGGRTYYGHPSLKRKGFPTIPHQSSATGMQAIPATGMAHGLAYLHSQGLLVEKESIVLCSLGDGSVTEGEVAEAFQMAVLKKLPIIYLVQDNDWGISATGREMRTMDAYEYAAGFKGLERMRVDGSDFIESYNSLMRAFDFVRKERRPILVHAKCPLLGHHTSGVRKEWYRGDNLQEQEKGDPIVKLEAYLLANGQSSTSLKKIQDRSSKKVQEDYEQALSMPDPDPTDFDSHEFALTEILEEKGTRSPKGGEKLTMVDAALHAVDEICDSIRKPYFMVRM
jgi:2-oxoisovalerate dehydrogenase E1 component